MMRESRHSKSVMNVFPSLVHPPSGPPFDHKIQSCTNQAKFEPEVWEGSWMALVPFIF
jgi:hypothetical protein